MCTLLYALSIPWILWRDFALVSHFRHCNIVFHSFIVCKHVLSNLRPFNALLNCRYKWYWFHILCLWNYVDYVRNLRQQESYESEYLHSALMKCFNMLKPFQCIVHFRLCMVLLIILCTDYCSLHSSQAGYARFYMSSVFLRLGSTWNLTISSQFCFNFCPILAYKHLLSVCFSIMSSM